MTAIDLASTSTTLAKVLDMAGEDNVLLRTPEGRQFILAEIDDFAEEIAATRQNNELMALLDERSKEPGKYTLAEVRQRIGGKRTNRGLRKEK